MSIVTLLPFIVLIGAMFLMTRSAKKKQQQAAQMRDEMQPGTGIRTIGGMYATVKEIHDDTVLLEVAPGVHALYAKNAVGAVLADEEYNRILDGAEGKDHPVVPDDASSLTEAAPAATAADDKADDKPANLDKSPKADLSKSEPAADAKDAAKADDAEVSEKAEDAGEAGTGAQAGKADKKDGGADAK
ncbi:preprotein translocase subunit YajC [Streptomyces albofaciens JCM 4342]|uniref:preprotein translocase subunit YajC n=1 Tax=Streptomyces albofaciens TaxID=66866 RepID=UPI00123C1CDB|nr:preprotein translocase subunit YajC [Streptomyces albofaciens]KAA6223020.1 preprotein translocase subunit YajC [Streptomyces albofaciens JCM 4342]